jgi:hypothetical protein
MQLVTLRRGIATMYPNPAAPGHGFVNGGQGGSHIEAISAVRLGVCVASNDAHWSALYREPMTRDFASPRSNRCRRLWCGPSPACLRSMIPLDANLVVLDFSVNGGNRNVEVGRCTLNSTDPPPPRLIG